MCLKTTWLFFWYSCEFCIIYMKHYLKKEIVYKDNDHMQVTLLINILAISKYYFFELMSGGKLLFFFSLETSNTICNL